VRLLAAVLYVRRELAPFGLYVGSSHLAESHIDSIAMESSVITVSGIYTSTSSGISSLAGAGISDFAGCGTSALELYVRWELTCPKSIFPPSRLTCLLRAFPAECWLYPPRPPQLVKVRPPQPMKRKRATLSIIYIRPVSFWLARISL
jgi:hypothetical protein